MSEFLPVKKCSCCGASPRLNTITSYKVDSNRRIVSFPVYILVCPFCSSSTTKWNADINKIVDIWNNLPAAEVIHSDSNVVDLKA